MSDVAQPDFCEDHDPEECAGQDIEDGWFADEEVTSDGVDPGSQPGQPQG